MQNKNNSLRLMMEADIEMMSEEEEEQLRSKVITNHAIHKFRYKSPTFNTCNFLIGSINLLASCCKY